MGFGMGVTGGIPTWTSLQVLSVKDYGATGDGSTDDTSAINAAIAAATEGDTVLFPNGSYVVGTASALTIASKTGVSIVGTGATIVAANVAYTQVEHGHPLLYVNTCSQCKITGLRFDGTANLSTNSVAAVMVEDSTDVTLYGLEAWGMSSNAAFLEADSDRTVWDSCIARDSRASSSSRGFWLGNGSATAFTRDTTVVNCKAINNDATGIVLFSVGSKCHNNISNSNAGSGIIHGGANSYKVEDSTVTGNHCEANTFYGYQNDSVATGGDILANLTITGNTLVGNTQGGALFNDAEDMVFSGNAVKNNLGPAVVIEGGVTRLIVQGNILVDDQGTATQDQGIKMNPNNEACTDIIIRDNIIEGNQTYGMSLQTVNAGASYSGVYVDHNIIRNNGTFGIFSAIAGTVANFSVNNNIFSGHSTRDVRLNGITTSTTVEFYDNVFDEDYGSINAEGLGKLKTRPVTFTASDATPSVGSSSSFETDTGTLTITDLDDGSPGQLVTIKSNGAITYDVTGTNLNGGTVDLVTAADDITQWWCEDGTVWRLVAFMDDSVDNSGGA